MDKIDQVVQELQKNKRMNREHKERIMQMVNFILDFKNQQKTETTNDDKPQALSEFKVDYENE